MASRTLEVTTADGSQQVEAKHIVIATGSRPVRLPFVSDQDRPLPGMDLRAVIDSTDALALEALPRREKPSGHERVARQR